MSTNKNNFIFTCTKLPLTESTITDISLPGITMGEPEYVGRSHDIKIPSNKFLFDNVDIEFIVNEDFSNHKEIYDWMNSIRSYDENDIRNMMFDATIVLLSNNKQPTSSITIESMFPVSLAEINFSSSDGSTVQTCSASFAITQWKHST